MIMPEKELALDSTRADEDEDPGPSSSEDDEHPDATVGGVEHSVDSCLFRNRRGIV